MKGISSYIDSAINKESSRYNYELLKINFALHNVFTFCIWCAVFERIVKMLLHYEVVSMVCKNYPFSEVIFETKTKQFEPWSNFYYTDINGVSIKK